MADTAKTYTLVTGRVAINATSGIALFDSRGNGVKCNYFEVMATDPSTPMSDFSGGWFTVELSATADGVNKVGSSPTFLTTSGIIGRSSHVTNPVTLSVAGNGSCSSLTISNRTGTGVRFIVNYGNSAAQNPLRGSISNPGN